jgi:hypothetical protein
MKPRSPLTPMQVERIIELTKAGVYVSVIEKRLGLGKNELWSRIHRAESEEATEAEESFAKAFRAAEADAEIRLTEILYAEAQANPDFALKLLERRFPKRWAGRSEGEREEEPTRPTSSVPIAKARDVAKAGRLRAVRGGK